MADPTKDLSLSLLVKPFTLLLDQLCQLVTIDPVFLNYFCWMHLVVKIFMLSLAVQDRGGVIIPIGVLTTFSLFLLFVFLLSRVVFCAKDAFEVLNRLIDDTGIIPSVMMLA